MENHLDEMSEAFNNLAGIANKLAIISLALFRVGNDKLAEDLSVFSSEILKSSEQVQNALNADLTDQIGLLEKHITQAVEIAMDLKKENQVD